MYNFTSRRDSTGFADWTPSKSSNLKWSEKLGKDVRTEDVRQLFLITKVLAAVKQPLFTDEEQYLNTTGGKNAFGTVQTKVGGRLLVLVLMCQPHSSTVISDGALFRNSTISTNDFCDLSGTEWNFSGHSSKVKCTVTFYCPCFGKHDTVSQENGGSLRFFCLFNDVTWFA